MVNAKKVFNGVMWNFVAAPILVALLTGLTLILTNGILFSVLSCIGVTSQSLKLAIATIANLLSLPYVISHIFVQIYAIPYETYSSF